MWIGLEENVSQVEIAVCLWQVELPQLVWQVGGQLEAGPAHTRHPQHGLEPRQGQRVHVQHIHIVDQQHSRQPCTSVCSVHNSAVDPE